MRRDYRKKHAGISRTKEGASRSADEARRQAKKEHPDQIPQMDFVRHGEGFYWRIHMIAIKTEKTP